jgi:cytochrome c553
MYLRSNDLTVVTGPQRSGAWRARVGACAACHSTDAERAAALFARLEARAEHAAMEEWISVRRRSMN